MLGRSISVAARTLGIAFVLPGSLQENIDHLLICSIAVTPDAQRKGYGRALLDFADQRAIELGLHEVRLYTNEQMERNLTLYRRHGLSKSENDHIRADPDRCSSTWFENCRR